MKMSILSDCQYYLKMYRYKTPRGALHMNHTVLTLWQLDRKRSDGLYWTFATFSTKIVSKLWKYPSRADVYKNALLQPSQTLPTSFSVGWQCHVFSRRILSQPSTDRKRHSKQCHLEIGHCPQLRLLIDHYCPCPRSPGQHAGGTKGVPVLEAKGIIIRSWEVLPTQHVLKLLLLFGGTDILLLQQLCYQHLACG